MDAVVHVEPGASVLPSTSFWRALHRGQHFLLLAACSPPRPCALQMTLPLPAGRPVLHAGEAAEVFVLSDRPNCSRFKALRDVYLPRRKMWLSQELAIEHSVFEDISTRLVDVRPAGVGVKGSLKQSARPDAAARSAIASSPCPAEVDHSGY
jgi:hypothetical protein